jgi:tetratricopeptide (TPR) repeat protein
MAIDPLYAEAHASLGFSYFMSAMLGLRSLRETMPLIRAEAQEALTLDPSNPGPHILLASVAAAYDYDWKLARELFETGMAGPSPSAEAHWAYASLFLLPLGRHDESVAHMERAVERDPLNAFWRVVLANHLTHARRPEEAIRQAHEALEIDETFLPVADVMLAGAYILMERWEEAAAALEKLHRLLPNGLSAGLLAGTLVHLGDRARADALIREMGETPRPLSGRVLYHLLCSDIDQAADWYERAINARDPFALVCATDPLGSDLRQSSRWPKLARMMNLPTHD